MIEQPSRKGTELGAGSPSNHVMKQNKLSFTCKERLTTPGTQDWETAEP